jgi:peptidoglycan/LPS O-acetylase OafA/YrhL
LGIEFLRILSSIAVLVFHYQHFSFVGAKETSFIFSQQPFFPLLRLFYAYGFYGVEIFWCISGFIFFWKYGEAIAAKTIGGYSFFILRLSRLYPLHFVTLLFMAATQYLYFHQEHAYFVYQYNDVYHFILQLGLASNWGLQLGDSFNGPIWSISIEVLVYAIFFLSLRYLSARPWIIALFVAASALIQVGKISEHPLFPCIMFFYLGCLTAIAFRRCCSSSAATKRLAITAFGAAVAITILQHMFDLNAKYFLVIFAPSVILVCVIYIPESRAFSRILVPAGNMTYASYLLHVPIQITVVLVCLATDIQLPFYSGTFFLCFIIGTLALSHWTYARFEMPAQRLLRSTLMPRRADRQRAA